MKNKEVPSAHSLRGDPSVQVDLHFPDDAGTKTTGSPSRPGDTAAACAEQPALSDSTESLIQQVVDGANLEAACKNVKRNRGAPGPDGITIANFPEWFRPRWPTIRQQLLNGTYRPDPVRRKTIDKPEGGKRLLGIPNRVDRLVVNEEKSRVVANTEFEFLGFSFPKSEATINVAMKSVRRLKQRTREITGRSQGISMDRRFGELRRYVRGLMGYFGIASQLTLFDKLDQWIPRRQTIRHARSRKGYWRMAKTIASGVGMTNAWLAEQGLLSMKTLWAQLAPLRRTA